MDDTSQAGKNTSRNYVVEVAAEGALQIVTGSLPDGTQKGDYSATLQTIGGTNPYTWTVTKGKLPDGITLDSATGIISGTILDKGDFNFSVMVTDKADPANTDTQSLTIHVASEILTE